MVSMQWVSAMYTVQDKTESGPSQCRGLELSMASHLRVFLERATFFLGFGFTEQKHAGVEEVQGVHREDDHRRIEGVCATSRMVKHYKETFGRERKDVLKYHCVLRTVPFQPSESSWGRKQR